MRLWWWRAASLLFVVVDGEFFFFFLYRGRSGVVTHVQAISKWGSLFFLAPSNIRTLYSLAPVVSSWHSRRQHRKKGGVHSRMTCLAIYTNKKMCEVSSSLFEAMAPSLTHQAPTLEKKKKKKACQPTCTTLWSTVDNLTTKGCQGTHRVQRYCVPDTISLLG